MVDRVGLAISDLVCLDYFVPSDNIRLETVIEAIDFVSDHSLKEILLELCRIPRFK